MEDLELFNIYSDELDLDSISVDAVALSPFYEGKRTVLKETDINQEADDCHDIPLYRTTPSTSSDLSSGNNNCYDKMSGIQLHQILELSKSIIEIEQALPSIKNFNIKLCRVVENSQNKDLDITLEACKYVDLKGKLALHILSENQDLIENAHLNNKRLRCPSMARLKMGKSSLSLSSTSLDIARSVNFDKCSQRGLDLPVEGLSGIVHSLLAYFPQACIAKDSDGYIPFSRIISTWIEQMYLELEKDRNDSKKKRSLFTSHDFVHKAKKSSEDAFQAMASSVSLVRTLRNSSRRAQDNSSFLSSSIKCASKVSPMDNSYGASKLVRDSELGDPNSGTCRTGLSLDQASRWEALFPQVKLVPSNVLWALYALSSILENIEQIILGNTQDEDDLESDCTIPSDHIIVHSQIIIDKFVDEVASIPFFVKTLLLVDDDYRDDLMNFPIVRRVLMSKCSLGKWLVSMLRSNHGEKAVTYLEELSITPKHFLDDSGRVIESPSYVEYSKRLKDLFKSVSQLEDLIPSMLMLNADMIEKVATTKIIRLILDKMISGRFALTLLFLDCLFLALFILSYRISINLFLGDDRGDSSLIIWVVVVHICLFYFCVREMGKILALSINKKEVIQRHLLRVWFLLDILSVPITLYTTISVRAAIILDDYDAFDHDNFIVAASLTTALLWIRVVSLLKTINTQLATFVLATIQIVQDIAWFLLFIGVVVIAAGQIFFTINCESSYIKHDASHISCRQADIYFYTYKILLGDLEDLNSTLDSNYSTLLFVVFSFLAIIILLNVLIAIISDSHEKCLYRSDHLFGRARIMLIAELASFQYLLRDSRKISTFKHNMKNNVVNYLCLMAENICGDRPWGSVAFFMLSTILFIFWAIMELISSHRQGVSCWAAVASIASNSLILLLFGKLCAFESSDISRSMSKQNSLMQQIGQLYSYCIEHIMSRILGVHDLGDKKHEVSRWKGRTDFLKTNIEKALQQSEARTLSEVERVCNEQSVETRRSTSLDLDLMVKSISDVTKGSISKEVRGMNLEFSSIRKDYDTKADMMIEQIKNLRITDEKNAEHFQIRIKKIEDENKAYMKSIQHQIDRFENQFRRDIHDSEERIRGLVEENTMRLVSLISQLTPKQSQTVSSLTTSTDYLD